MYRGVAHDYIIILLEFLCIEKGMKREAMEKLKETLSTNFKKDNPEIFDD